MKRNDNRNIKIHGLPELGVFYKGRTVEDYENLLLKNRPCKRSHSPMFAAIVFALFLSFFYFVTDMGRYTPDMPRDRSITTQKKQ